MTVAALEGKIGIARMIKEAGLAPSNAEANRNIEQGGVRIEGERVTDKGLQMAPGTYTVQVGKRRWAKVTVIAGGAQ